MTARLRPADLFVFDGQSLANTPDSVDNFPSKVKVDLDGVSRVVALSGTSYAQRTVAVGSRVDRLLSGVAGTRVLIDCPMQAEILAGDSAATIIATAEAYWNARRAEGFDFIICTTVIDAEPYDAAMDAVRATLNTSIRSSSALDAVADLALIPEFIPHVTGTYSSDGIHVNDAATDLIAPVVLAAIQSVL